MYLHHRRDKTYPSQDELITLLRGIETMFVVSFYVVEGLDEALNNTQFDLISALSLLKGKFVITSRPLAHSESDIPSAKFFTIVARAEDIRLALNQKLVLNPRFRRLIEQHRCKEEITSKIIQKSNGMFLHAALQIEALQQCLTITSLRASLEQFPNKMTDMYRTTLQRVENQSPEHSALAKRVLLWVNYAQCPLSVRDIQCALAICPQTDTFKKDLVVDEATLIAVCYGLIGVEKTGTVHLIHSTARDFVSQFLRGIYRNPHEVLARTSIQRLVACKLIESDEAFEEWDLEDAFAQYPLLQYSYNYWAFHAKKCQSDPEFDALLRFFMSKCAAFPCNLAQDDWEWNEGTLDLLKPLHLAARHGFHQFIPEFLLLEGQSQEHSWSALNSRTRGKFGATALMLASHYNHTTAVKVLVRVRGINVNAVNGSGRTALHLAARKGHELAVRCLLQARDIDPNAVDEEGYTPLMLAAEKGHVGVVRVLARVPGVQPNVATVQHRQTALMLAAEGGFEDAVRILLRVGGTDVNMRDWDGRTALMVASNEGHGHGAVGCILQDPDVQVNLKDWNHRTALMLASKEGHADTVGQLLRVPGLDVNSTRRGMTALMMAASEGHQDVVRGLLRFEGVDANAVTDEGGWTALMLAARGGHESVVRLLVTCGSARVDIASKSGRTALDLASDNAHHGIVRLLTQVRI
ncbi:ankyrin repeat domain-containing protein 50 [Coprinopsis cinerea AmutBmut pab1-1]|nr:ankyrin repeat domain-containing protein 50 [Coprinopsis cinerea AmutBmut pab1-1]